jgi:hypothetical protein
MDTFDSSVKNTDLARVWLAGDLILIFCRTKLFLSSHCPNSVWDPPGLLYCGYQQPLGHEADLIPPHSI